MKALEKEDVPGPGDYDLPALPGFASALAIVTLCCQHSSLIFVHFVWGGSAIQASKRGVISYILLFQQLVELAGGPAALIAPPSEGVKEEAGHRVAVDPETDGFPQNVPSQNVASVERSSTSRTSHPRGCWRPQVVAPGPAQYDLRASEAPFYLGVQATLSKWVMPQLYV